MKKILLTAFLLAASLASSFGQAWDTLGYPERTSYAKTDMLLIQESDGTQRYIQLGAWFGDYEFDILQTPGAGQDNYVLTYDNATGKISLEAATGGGQDWSDPVDANIIPDADGTRDLGADATRFREGFFDDIDVTNDVQVGGDVITPSLEISGATSGTVTVAVPAVAGSNTITLPAATDTLVGRATTDTLTNKTIDGDDNTLQDVPVTALERIPGAVFSEILSASHTLSISASTGEGYGSVHAVDTDAVDISLAAATSGANFTISVIGAITIDVDPDADDQIYLDGVLLDDGDKITSTGSAGDLATFTYIPGDDGDGGRWLVSTNGWTDGGA